MENVASLRSLAAAGDPKAQLRLAHLMLAGRERAFSADEPMRLLNAACAQRLGDALMYHAALAVRGHGRPRDLEDATRLLSEAAAAGDTRAKGQLMALGGKIDREAWFAPVQMVQQCEAPRVFTIENFIPKSACSWLIKMGRKNLQRAPTQKAELNGAMVIDEGRSNSLSGTNILHPDVVLQLANLRIAATIREPLEHQEATNLLHYARGQEYRTHFDFIRPEEEAGFAHELRTIGQRIVTFLIYLNEDYEGGETEFPLLNWRFKGKTGDALVWWNLSATGEREPLSLHAGLPVTKGEKWLFSKWVRQRPVPVV